MRRIFDNRLEAGFALVCLGLLALIWSAGFEMFDLDPPLQPAASIHYVSEANR